MSLVILHLIRRNQ